MWVYSSITESSHPIKIFEYRPYRSTSNAQEFLKGFTGIIISDGYQGYNHIEGVVNAYCWAHVRRRFRDAKPDDISDPSATLAKEGINKIARMFAIEKNIESLSPSEKVKARQEKSKPLLDDFFSWCSKNEYRVLTRSKLGKAISYALRYEKGLREYVNDGLIPMTNSLYERTILPFTVGRKNWLFSSSTDGAEASAAAFSLIETAKANRLDPYDYMEYLLEAMPDMDFMNDPGKLDELMPWSTQIKEKIKTNVKQ